MRHIISSEVIKIDPSKTEPVTKIPLPRSVNELQRFLGMVKYLGKFIPNLDAFELQKPQLDEIENLKILKNLVTSAPCLKISDLKLTARLRIDASSVGLNDFIEQSYGTVQNEKWHPIGYLSPTLRYYEKRYVQIEKRTLLIVFGVKRFHECLYGRRFIVINEHKLLKSIFNKLIISCHTRIQNFFYDSKSTTSNFNIYAAKTC